MDVANQASILSEDRRMYMEIKTRLERDPHIKSNLPSIISSYEGIKPRARERICNVTELLIELEQRCIIRYYYHFMFGSKNICNFNTIIILIVILNIHLFLNSK